MNNAFLVIRFYIKDGVEGHSIQKFDDKLIATQRFYNIIAADLADTSITYQYTEIRGTDGGIVDGLNPVIYTKS